MEPNDELALVPLDEIQAAPTERLREELSRALTLTARGLAYLAAVWQELERRGDDLSGLRAGLAQYLPLIAAGRLDPSTVVRFAGQRMILRYLANLSLDEQRRLTAGGVVPVVMPTAEGDLVERQLPVAALTAAQARIVFDEGRIRTLAEQRRLHESARRRRPARHHMVRGIAVDRATGAIVFGRQRYAPVDVFAALAAARPAVEADDQRERHFLLRLTEPEHRALRVAAAEAGLSMQDLALTALRETGLIGRPSVE